MNDFEEFPGGIPAVIGGAVIALAIVALSAFNIMAGLCVLGVVGILFFLCIRSIINSEILITVLSSTLASLPVFLCVYLLFMAMVSLICWLVLLFL
jgi:hypothetical protein